MKRRMMCLCLALILAGMGALCPAGVRAEGETAEKDWNFYLIPDSNTRELTEQEIWQWDYDSLWYLINEIFARHGFVFVKGGQFYDYFNRQQWYKPNNDTVENRIAYDQTTDVEWHNEHLIKVVMEQMQAQNTKNDKDTRSWRNAVPPEKMPDGFHAGRISEKKMWKVYSAPREDAWRGANGKACFDSGDAYWTMGQENGWVLVMYAVKNTGYRIGYADMQDYTTEDRNLKFESVPCTISKDTVMTDDPIASLSPVFSLREGDDATYLASYTFGDENWAYIEVEQNGVTARGFVPVDAVGIVVLGF